MIFKDESLSNLTFTSSNRPLSQNESGRLTSFLLAIAEAQLNGLVTLIYRGESLANLQTKFNIDSPLNYDLISQYLFLIGEKGRGYRKTYRKKVTDKTIQFGISDVSSSVFRYIFRKYNQCLRIRKRVIIGFSRQHPVFRDFFLNTNNEEIFLKKVNSLTKSQKLDIRDYYLKPLHHLGAIGYFNNSIFVSTSEEFKIAKKFASGFDKESIIIVSWDYISLSQKGIGRKLDKLNLPTYIRPFYYRQNEVTIKGGLLPHYIIGYIKVDTHEFVTNPNFFSTNKNFETILREGLNIDQSGFASALKKTDYEVYFIVDENRNFRDVALITK